MKKICAILLFLFVLGGCQTTKHISTNTCGSVEHIHGVSVAYNLAANLGDKEYSVDVVKPFLGTPDREKEINGRKYYFYQKSKDCEVSIEVKEGIMNYFKATGEDCYGTANYLQANHGPWGWTTVSKNVGGTLGLVYYIEGCLYLKDE